MTSVDVLAATKDGKVKDIIVVPLDDYDLEYAARHALMKMYGTENVFVGMFEIGSVPQDVVRVMVANPIFKKNEWIPYTSLSAPASNARVLVKMKNNYTVIATYYYVGNQSSYWKDDRGQILEQGVVNYWKVLEE